ncbi:hypothetical protein NUW58_g4748 [Xylaria curta]|uniref:Uncharacterized protein n=1 Tax=Xylaria curta TaxID=42375 RepID=A0ACC1P7B0_9PEZI|nr:hypothetical protein NUW58_g4748 [Xylaria curta]
MDRQTELPEPFLSLLLNIGRPMPPDFPRNAQRPSFHERVEAMPEDLFRDTLPAPILHEMTQSVFNESLKDVVEESKDILSDEDLQIILSDFNNTLPEEIPRPPREQAIQLLRHTLVEQSIHKHEGLFDECREILLNQHIQFERDRFREFVDSGRHRSLADGDFIHASLKMWRRLYPGFRDKFSILKPDLDEMCSFTEQVQMMVQDLRGRDERFSFILSALDEFIRNDDGPHVARECVNRIISADPNGLEDDALKGILSEILTVATSIRTKDPANSLNKEVALREIIDSAIYQLLHVFQQDLSLEQLPLDIHSTAHFQTFRNLYERSKVLSPQAAIQVNLEPQKGSQNEARYQYPTRLDSESGEIRILEILPGAKDEPIECHLLVRNVHQDGVSEALSYVWGNDKDEEKIRVDHKDFTIRKNLHRILRGLRHPDTTREIWIDAICINQSDSEEKGGQVNMMGMLYSKAKSTTIWLSGDPLDHDFEEYHREEQSFDMEGWYSPIPAGLGGIYTDQYDLATILRKAQKHSIEDSWNERQWILYTMLLRCIGLVLMCSWWERVWTIQEAAMNSPIFFFRGHTFPFADLTEAMNISSKLSSGSEHVQRQIENKHNVIGPASSDSGLLSRGPLLLHYRRGLEAERDDTLKSFPVLLGMTETYRATNPRDKIFALKSLVHNYAGLLINVDYSEHCETIYRRATARCYNQDRTFDLVGLYRFWFESSLSAEKPTAPSWVLDFTYNDAGHCGSLLINGADEKVTLDGFISENHLPRFQLENDVNGIHFCTPTTLLCTGRRVDRISYAITSPKLSDFTSFISLALQLLKYRESLLGLPITTEFDEPAKAAILYLVRFILLESGRPRSLEGLASTRGSKLTGKSIFITQKGLVGLATMPITQGDFIAWIHYSPIYLILREVKDQDNSLDDMQEHRIVARAIIYDKLVNGMEDIKALVKSVPTRKFKIV